MLGAMSACSFLRVIVSPTCDTGPERREGQVRRRGLLGHGVVDGVHRELLTFTYVCIAKANVG
jgi:hypothetical protein